MEIEGKLDALAAKLEQQQSVIQTEEATKTAFIMPFIQNILGYDVFNPTEVIPEFTADIGIKKGEKVDYAISKDGEVQILIECKKLGESLNLNHASQLFRYFSVTTARIGVLTNGRIYQFFTDLDHPNKMDERPFLSIDLLDIDDHVIPELAKLTKPAFDLNSVLSAAGELKYVGLLKRAIVNQFSSPCEDFAKLLICKAYDGVVTQKVREQFSPLIGKAIKQFLNDRVNDRLKTAISSPVAIQMEVGSDFTNQESESQSCTGEKDEIVTSQEELDGFNIIRAIARSEVDVKRITARDTLSYFGILLDDNNRKPVCRLHFNRQQKYLGLFDKDKKETRHPIQSLDDIFTFADQLKETIYYYN